LRGGNPKEISLKTLSKIINARVVEIIEQVFAEIRAYGHEEPKKKLIAGIVLTGGGSQLKHIKQLVEYLTGMDTRIGYPNEHLAGNSGQDILSPLYATAVGLVMDSLSKQTQSAVKIEAEQAYEIIIDDASEKTIGKDISSEVPSPSPSAPPKPPTGPDKKTILDRYVEKIKQFLEDAE
jgi:cell division protein FtsA